MELPRTRRFIKTCFITVGCIMLIVFSYTHLSLHQVKEIALFVETGDLYCYEKHAPSLPVITKAKFDKPSIFFLETTCRSDRAGRIILNARQACSVESAAKANPNTVVNLLYLSPGLIGDTNIEPDRIMKAVLSYDNVFLYRINIEEYVSNTPVEQLFKNGELKKSLYQTVHASDILRMLTLWKYGGMYLDLDIIVMKSLEKMDTNFVVPQTVNEMANGAMAFSIHGSGHKYAEYCLYNIVKNYNGETWAGNGPDVVKRMTDAVCRRPTVFGNLTHCKDLTIYPPKTFYAIYYTSWQKFFNINYTRFVDNEIKDSKGVHFWNKLSAHLELSLDSNAPYLNLARKYCPKVIKQLDTVF